MKADIVWAIVSDWKVNDFLAALSIIGIFLSVILHLKKYGTVKFKNISKKKKNMKLSQNMIQKHEKKISDIEQILAEMRDDMQERKKREIKKLRHDLILSCESAIQNECITVSKLCSIEDMYGDYRRLCSKNGYVKTLMVKARNLKIIKNVEVDSSMKEILLKGKNED